MERAAWTDERLDDLSHRMDARFDRVDADIRDLQVAMQDEIGALRSVLLRVGGGMMIGLLGVIAAILARGT